LRGYHSPLHPSSLTLPCCDPTKNLRAYQPHPSPPSHSPLL